MITWFVFALIAAISHSLYGFFQKRAVSISVLPKSLIIFCASFFSAIILFLISFLNGFPEIGDKFLMAILITGVLNIIAAFLFLRAYEIAEFSSVFPMLLLTPIFSTGTSYFILGEKVSMLGFIGIIITLFGLFIMENGAPKGRGVFLGIVVAFLFSISTNFDKMATLNSNAIFSGAVVNLIIALGVLPILIYFSRKNSFGKISIKNFSPLLVLGVFSASTTAFHNLALGIGLVSYVILIKRTSVIWGVIWGTIFLKEGNIFRKIIGVVIAVVGIAIILLK